MKKTVKLFTLIALLSSITPAAAQNYKTREVPNAPAFNAIEVKGGDVNVFFSQGEKHSFSVSGPTKAVKATSIKIKENTLSVNYDEPFFFGDDNDLNVYITAPEINRITVAGEADFESKTVPFKGKELTIKTQQSGEVSINDIAVEKININAKGSSSVDLKYLKSNLIRVSSSDRAEVDLSGTTNQIEVAKKGMFAEIDTEKLMIKQQNKTTATQQVAKDGGVEFVFND